MTIGNRNTISRQEPLQRLPVRGDYTVLLLRLNEIRYIEARKGGVYARTRDGGDHRVSYTLTQLEILLPSERFVRIHNSFLVSQDEIEELLFLGNHSYEIRLSTDRRLPVSRARYARLRQSLGLDSAHL